MKDNIDDEIDETIPYVRSIERHQDAEDVVTVTFHGDAKSVAVGITDEVMSEFLEVAGDAFRDIRDAELKEILADAEDDDE